MKRSAGRSKVAQEWSSGSFLMTSFLLSLLCFFEKDQFFYSLIADASTDLLTGRRHDHTGDDQGIEVSVLLS